MPKNIDDFWPSFCLYLCFKARGLEQSIRRVGVCAVRGSIACRLYTDFCMAALPKEEDAQLS